MSYTFDGPNKRIYLPTGPTTLDLIDLHSRWKDWVLADNAQYLPAFGTVGGEITEIPLYLFELNGWTTILPSANQTLDVTNGVYIKQGGGDPFTDSGGGYSIHINRIVPGVAIGYSSTGSTITVSEVADEVLSRIYAENYLSLKQFLALK